MSDCNKKCLDIHPTAMRKKSSSFSLILDFFYDRRNQCFKLLMSHQRSPYDLTQLVGRDSALHCPSNPSSIFAKLSPPLTHS